MTERKAQPQKNSNAKITAWDVEDDSLHFEVVAPSGVRGPAAMKEIMGVTRARARKEGLSVIEAEYVSTVRKNHYAFRGRVCRLDEKTAPPQEIVGRPPMIEEQSWAAFRASGLAWWINRILHTFGWALAFEIMKEDYHKPLGEQKIIRVYPVHCKFRGFDEKSETEGFANLTAHMEESLPRLKEDLKA